MFGGDWEIIAMFTLADGRKVWVQRGFDGLQRAFIMDQVFMSSFNCQTNYVEVTEMGCRDAHCIPTTRETRAEVLISEFEFVEGVDLINEFDPINQKSNNELLRVLNQRYAKKVYDENR